MLMMPRIKRRGRINCALLCYYSDCKYVWPSQRNIAFEQNNNQSKGLGCVQTVGLLDGRGFVRRVGIWPRLCRAAEQKPPVMLFLLLACLLTPCILWPNFGTLHKQKPLCIRTTERLLLCLFRYGVVRPAAVAVLSAAIGVYWQRVQIG